ncbi:MAG: ABC transporter permease [Acidothermaceae bacterium]
MTQGIGDALVAGRGEQEPDLDASGSATAKKIEGRSPFALAFTRLRRDRAAVISFWVIVAIALIAIIAPVFAMITGHGVNHQYRGLNALSPAGQPHPPSGTFWFGTDDQGRDLLVRVAYGARISLMVGLGATAITIIIGVVVGMITGYFGGIVDTILARIIDVVLSIPYLLFAVAIVSVVGHINVVIIMFVIGAFGWASVGRIIRGQVLSIREREYIEAARSLGASDWRIIFHDILPNVVAPAIVFSTLLLPVSIVAEAALSFLGVGVQPPTADWGEMISTSQQYVDSGVAWWYLFFPGIALVITTLAFNILGDGVRDAFDPRSDRLFAK